MGKAEKPEKTSKKQKHFWKDFKAELKKVIWPTKSQVINNTVIVIAIVLIVTAIVFVLDLAFEALNTYGINKLKTIVQNSVVTEDENETNAGSNENENQEENDETGENHSEGENSQEENNEQANGQDAPNDTTNVENTAQ